METILLVIDALFLLFVAFGICVAAETYYYQERLGPDLEKDLGFRYGKVLLDVGGWIPHIGYCIEEVSRGGEFERAGFKEGDVMAELTSTDLLRMLHRHRGRECSLAVVDSGEGPPFC